MFGRLGYEHKEDDKSWNKFEDVLEKQENNKDPKSPSYFNQPDAACASPPPGHAMEIS